MNKQKIFYVLLSVFLIQNSTAGTKDFGFKELFSWFNGQTQQQSKPNQILSKIELISEIYDLLHIKALLIENHFQNYNSMNDERFEMDPGQQKRMEKYESRLGFLNENLPEGLEAKIELENLVKSWRENDILELDQEITLLRELPEKLGQLASKFKFKFDGEMTNKLVALQIIDHFGNWDFEKHTLYQFLANSEEFYYSQRIAKLFGKIASSKFISKHILELIEQAEKGNIIEQKYDGCLVEIRNMIRNVENKLSELELNLCKKMDINLEKGKIEYLLAKSSLRNNFSQNLPEKLDEIKKIAHLEGKIVSNEAIIEAFAISQIDDLQNELKMSSGELEQFSFKCKTFKTFKNIVKSANSLKKLRKILLHTEFWPEAQSDGTFEQKK